MAEANDLDVELDRGDLSRLHGEVTGFGRALQAASRERFREALGDVVDEMRDRVTSGPARTDVGLRQGIAAGIRIRDTASGVEVSATADALPAAKAALVAAFNQPSFRHPVYGGPGEATQSGRPYFGYTVDRHERAIEQSQAQALVDAARTVHSGEVTGA